MIVRFPSLPLAVVLVGVAFLSAAALVSVAGVTTAGAAATPVVTITPGPSAGRFTSGENVTVSVGPNSLFVPHSRVNIIECADPGGTKAGLPVNESTCDVNTIEADTVLVQADGSFTEHAYTLYATPNAVLGEQSNWLPDCNTTQQCVLYVGENQDDFTQPKIFSAPFTFTTAAATIAGGRATSSAAAAPTSTTDPVSASVSVPAATLAFTGPGPAWPWLAGTGVVLVSMGLLGRRSLRRRH
jgi:hypothetical protein